MLPIASSVSTIETTNRFSHPNIGHNQIASACLKGAISGLVQLSTNQPGRQSLEGTERSAACYR